MSQTGPLKLRAHDADDVQILSAVLQDALVPLCDAAYIKKDRKFVMVANRFRWEAEPMREPEVIDENADSETDARFEDAPYKGEGSDYLYERVNCGVCIDRVESVHVHGLKLGDHSQILNVLSIDASPSAITMHFSGGSAIRLAVSDIRCWLEDINEPWPTRWLPIHPIADAPE